MVKQYRDSRVGLIHMNVKSVISSESNNHVKENCHV